MDLTRYSVKNDYSKYSLCSFFYLLPYEHGKKIFSGSWDQRVVHFLITFTEFLPIIGQIAAIFEMIIMQRHHGITKPQNRTPSKLRNTPDTSPLPICANVERPANWNQSLEPESQKIFNATRIQSIWRGYLAKVQVNKERQQVLSYADFERARPYIDHSKSLESLPIANAGDTRVYLPAGHPIVLKQSGTPHQKIRFAKMRNAREICEKNRYTHLVIPKARVYRDFIIESRVPIGMYDLKKTVRLYIEHQSKFTLAIKEFTGFLCQGVFRDIVGSWNFNNPHISNAGILARRYDNVPLYIEEEEGKIALIDLEEFYTIEEFYRVKLMCKEVKMSHVRQACEDAVHLFPYHLDDVISAAIPFDPTIVTHRETLENKRNESIKFFSLVNSPESPTTY